MSNGCNIEGVRGWLLILVIVIGVLTPLAQLGSVINLVNAEPVLQPFYSDNWSLYFGLTLFIIGLRTAVCLFVARELVYRTTTSVPRNAIVGIWIALGLLHILSLVVVAVLSPNPFPFADAANRMIWPIAICSIATIYLLKSRRVASTYKDPVGSSGTPSLGMK